MQSAPIATKVVSFNLAHGQVYLIQLYVIMSVVFSGYSTNKTDCHYIAKILLKVALNTITLILYISLGTEDESMTHRASQYVYRWEMGDTLPINRPDHSVCIIWRVHIQSNLSKRPPSLNDHLL